MAKRGGADRDRTDDLRLAKPALSQLSYSPKVAGGPPRFGFASTRAALHAACQGDIRTRHGGLLVRLDRSGARLMRAAWGGGPGWI